MILSAIADASYASSVKEFLFQFKSSYFLFIFCAIYLLQSGDPSPSLHVKLREAFFIPSHVTELFPLSLIGSEKRYYNVA